MSMNLPPKENINVQPQPEQVMPQAQPAPAPTEVQTTEAQATPQVVEQIAEGIASDQIRGLDIIIAVLSDSLGISVPQAESLAQILIMDLADEAQEQQAAPVQPEQTVASTDVPPQV
mgnify:CR=1 FL=1